MNENQKERQTTDSSKGHESLISPTKMHLSLFKALLIAVAAVCIVGCICFMSRRCPKQAAFHRRILAEAALDALQSNLPPSMTVPLMRWADSKQIPTELLSIIHDYANDPLYFVIFMNKPQKDILTVLDKNIREVLIPQNEYRQILLSKGLQSDEAVLYKVQFGPAWRWHAQLEQRKVLICQKQIIPAAEMDCINQVLINRFGKIITIRIKVPDYRMDFSNYYIYEKVSPDELEPWGTWGTRNYLDAQRDYCRAQKNASNKRILPVNQKIKSPLRVDLSYNISLLSPSIEISQTGGGVETVAEEMQSVNNSSK